MKFLAGQVIVCRTDFTRSSALAALTLVSRWTHVALALGDGKVLNTYPGTNCEILPEAAVLTGRDYVVLDLPDRNPIWRRAVLKAARSLVDVKYFWSPCSVVTARAFRRAGVDIFGPHRNWRLTRSLLVPEDYFTRTRFVVVHQHVENPKP